MRSTKDEKLVAISEWKAANLILAGCERSK